MLNQQTGNVLVSYDILRSVFRSLSQYGSADFATLGITKADYDFVSSPEHFRAETRHRAVTTLEQLLYGATTVIGIGRLELPAEYVAAVIALNVHPANYQAACIFLSDAGTGFRPVIEMAAGNSYEGVDKSRLFALVCMSMHDEQGAAFRNAYRTRLGYAVEKAQATAA